MRLRSYRSLSFDVYGTLIDWESGIGSVLTSWAAEAGLDLDQEALLLAYAEHEAATEREQPTWLYPDVLAEAFRRTGERLGVSVGPAWAERLGASVPDWPAFGDSATALQALAERYDLIILSNVHRDGFAASNLHLRSRPTAIITAEDVGAYKPADPHFESLRSTLHDLQLAPHEHLHVAQSLFHDHVPAARHSLSSVWINRRHARPGWGATPEPAGTWSYQAEYPSMAAFVEAAERDDEV
ncbi:HAD-IA family hydrolase [Serinicoccus kebangsaanensis]|uniref:HAD-IA family hydrolase n=1 Tax=Serinicoccus kebangsaanensis TaxID=2602069 RepID=UPI00124E3F95|nr:HAD-IA family hydrolase [Serinicoccus kebangsaanensis]